MRRAEYQYAYYWNTGVTKKINEDSIAIQHVITRKGQILMACISDGMGGLQEGQVASGYIVEEASKWFYEKLLPIVKKTKKGCRKQRKMIQKAGFHMYYAINQELFQYGMKHKLSLGATATMIVLVEDIFYSFHIGDSRIYEIYNRKRGRVLTSDHSVNHFTLTKCMGMNPLWKPDFSKKVIKSHKGFLLCSDGFIHKLDKEILFKGLEPKKILYEKQIEKVLKEIGSRCMQRGEKDNISAIYIKL